MDDIRDDFEEKMEEDEIEALDEHELLLGIGSDEDEDPLAVADEENEDKLLDTFGFTKDPEEEF